VVLRDHDDVVIHHGLGRCDGLSGGRLGRTTSDQEHEPRDDGVGHDDGIPESTVSETARSAC
jgi:hypothetical protein